MSTARAALHAHNGHNEVPVAGDFVPGSDGELYRVVRTIGQIQTGRSPGAGNWVLADVELADWSDCEEGAEAQSLCVLEPVESPEHDD